MSLSAAILAIAPDPAFGASLGFVLEAEGCEVLLLKALPSTHDSMNTFDCVIVDDNALINKEKNLNHLHALASPIILLVDRSDEFSVGESFWIIEKPILGLKLIEAVRSALRAAYELRPQIYVT